ncbi:major facilitator superfamily domain-containing protein 6-like [Dendronephthya gigantea]|uniref:major facilitator superfamily domain-containing protein 6-like n=1 Tax=Dendronephthya gigantea TaxID=151771 RepID=UPI00106AA00D|nr:major facilitator superfamily domain-containing protein 6-like [Dendronephthya gigantea]
MMTMLTEKLGRILKYFHYQVFYFIFYGGYLPFLFYFPVYLKHIGLNTSQVGLVSGIRPVFQSIATPLLVLIGDRLHSRKLLFIVSSFVTITKLICLYLLLRPSHQQCVVKTVLYTNSSRTVTQHSFLIEHKLSKRDVMDRWSAQGKNQQDRVLEASKSEKRLYHVRKISSAFKREENHEMSVKTDDNDENAGNDLIAISNETKNENPERFDDNNITKHGQHSETEHYIINNEIETRNLFYSLLAVVLITDMFDAAMFTLVDHSCIQHQRESYGYTRLWGTLGWGLMTPVIAVVLHSVPHEFCGNIVDTYHYIFIFAIVFANISLIVGSHLGLDAEFKEVKVRKVHGTKSNFHYGMFLIVFAYAGFCNGFLLTFINWFIESIGGNASIMGVARGCKCIVDVILFFLMGKIIEYFDIVLVISVGLVGHIAVFFMYSCVTNPWLVVLIEVAHALFYGFLVSNCAYLLDQATPAGSNLRLQALLHGIYWAIGSGSGAIISGLHITYNGFRKTFLVFTFMTAAVAFIYFTVELLMFVIDIKTLDDQDQSSITSSTGSDADVSSEGQSSHE